ncbi:hypothetical protein O181_096418 [Austropuccinia psidii MF-1]|uniref:Uncharacterized protein n=1 Tax=Austropuccinia psidii MF-1 TaxID=1389203 RepID=A0A9Q3J5K7_9BASI|nr:hypothetical protein [Austropuccinia psidii MF-1]
MLEKGWKLRLPADTLRKEVIEIHPAYCGLKLILDKVKHHSRTSMDYSFGYAKQKLNKSHKLPDFKVGNLVLVSTLSLNNIKSQNKHEYSYVGSFVIIALHGTNAIKV